MSVANAVGFASVSESQGFAFAVASETSLDAERSVASKFFDWSCDAVQQRGGSIGKKKPTVLVVGWCGLAWLGWVKPNHASRAAAILGTEAHRAGP